jgi:hypothetical protein
VSEIAAGSGLSKRTLETHYCALIEKGREAGKQSLRHKQFQVAMTGNVSMLIWLGKQILGQWDRADHSNDIATLYHGDLPISSEFDASPLPRKANKPTDKQRAEPRSSHQVGTQKLAG